MVVVVKRNATTSGFEQVFVLVFSTEDGFDIQAGFARDVEEGDAQVGRRRCSFFLAGVLRGSGRSAQPAGASHFHDAFQGQDQRGPAER